MKKELAQKLWVQLGSVAATAAIAAMIAIVQSLADLNGISCVPKGDPAVAGSLGAILRAGYLGITTRIA